MSGGTVLHFLNIDAKRGLVASVKLWLLYPQGNTWNHGIHCMEGWGLDGNQRLS
jgi:hypothetical protein